MSKELAKKVLSPSFRITKIRTEIIKCLSDGYHSHTINDIVNHLKSHDKSLKINLASIYNTLNLLINEGIIFSRIAASTQKTNYEVANADGMHYHIFNIESKKESTHMIEKDFKNKLSTILSLVEVDDKYDIINVDLNIIVKEKK